MAEQFVAGVLQDRLPSVVTLKSGNITRPLSLLAILINQIVSCKYYGVLLFLIPKVVSFSPGKLLTFWKCCPHRIFTCWFNSQIREFNYCFCIHHFHHQLTQALEKFSCNLPFIFPQLLAVHRVFWANSPHRPKPNVFLQRQFDPPCENRLPIYILAPQVYGISQLWGWTRL